MDRNYALGRKKPEMPLGLQVLLASFNEAQPPTGGFVGRGWFVRMHILAAVKP